MFIIRSDKTRIFDVHFGGYLIANQSANSEETIRRAARELQHSCTLCGVHVLYNCEPSQLRFCIRRGQHIHKRSGRRQTSLLKMRSGRQKRTSLVAYRGTVHGNGMETEQSGVETETEGSRPR